MNLKRMHPLNLKRGYLIESFLQDLIRFQLFGKCHQFDFQETLFSKDGLKARQ